MTEYLGGRLRINEVSPAYWQVTIDNPPINMYDPRMFAALNQLMDRIDAAEQLRTRRRDGAGRAGCGRVHTLAGVRHSARTVPGRFRCKAARARSRPRQRV